MENQEINEAHIRGTVGTVRLTQVGGSTAANMSVATNFIYRSADGSAVCEVTWHSCTAWSGRDVDDLSSLQKGSKVDITGRLRDRMYTDAGGVEHRRTEIMVKTLKIID